MIGANLLRYNKTQKYLTLDTETSGLNLFAALPTQISFVTYTLDNNLEEHNYFILWPEKELRMSRGAAIVTRFNYEQYEAKAQDPEEVWEIVEKYIYSPEYILFNQNLLGYDSMIINNWRRKMGLKIDYDFIHNGKPYDTLALSKALRLKVPPVLENGKLSLSWQYKMIDTIIKDKSMKTSISAMLKEFKIQFNENELHDALVDVSKNREINRKLIWSLAI